MLLFIVAEIRNVQVTMIEQPWLNGGILKRNSKHNSRGWLGYLGGWMLVMVPMVPMVVGCHDGS